jgi:hypothetical protein
MRKHRIEVVLLPIIISFHTLVNGFFAPVVSSITMHRPSTILSATPSKAEFELQEVKAQLNAMVKQGIRPKMLNNEKRNELESYIQAVLRSKPSPIPLKTLADNGASTLHGNWTLVFSSENEGLGDLPRDATVEIIMLPNFKCEYKILFAKTLGMKSLTAKSSYIVDSSPVNPGLVTIIYQDIEVDAFGIKLPVGAFGMLKGRATYIDTQWFDGMMWIDRSYSSDGNQFYNVYIRN